MYETVQRQAYWRGDKHDDVHSRRPADLKVKPRRACGKPRGPDYLAAGERSAYARAGDVFAVRYTRTTAALGPRYRASCDFARSRMYESARVMSPGNAVVAAVGLIVGLSALSAVTTGSSEWGVGVFVVILILFFVSNRTRPAQRRHQRTVMRGDRLLRMSRKPLTP